MIRSAVGKIGETAHCKVDVRFKGLCNLLICSSKMHRVIFVLAVSQGVTWPTKNWCYGGRKIKLDYVCVYFRLLFEFLWPRRRGILPFSLPYSRSQTTYHPKRDLPNLWKKISFFIVPMEPSNPRPRNNSGTDQLGRTKMEAPFLRPPRALRIFLGDL